MSGLAGKTVVVTGATSGIGYAIAERCVADGAHVVLLGRSAEGLEQAREKLQLASPGCVTACHLLDLADAPGCWSDELAELAPDVLVHCAGDYLAAPILETSAADLEHLFRVNVSAPLALTQLLRAALVARQGQLVFVNSSVSQQPGRSNPGGYMAAKQAAACLAQSLRDALNESGVRVLSVYPGRTATRMQEQLFAQEQRTYNSAVLLQPEDVAEAVTAGLCLPRTAELTDLMIRPLQKS